MSARLIFCLFFVGLSYHQASGDLLGGLLSGLLGGGGGNNGGNGGGGGGGGLLGGNGLVGQLLGNILGGGANSSNCGLVANILGLCGPPRGQPCCRCCQGGQGVNDLCVTVGLLDLLFRTPNSCAAGAIIVCTAQACEVGQQCNVQAGNLLCADIGK